MLRLDGNRLRDIAAAARLPHLRELEARSNRLAAPPPVAGLRRLRRLRLDGNQLRALAPPACGGADSSASQHHALRSLSAASNQIESIGGGALPPSGAAEPSCGGGTDGAGGALARWCGASLEDLRLAGNRLASLAGAEGCARLRRVDVGHNRLADLAALGGCPLLQVLLAPGNALRRLDAAPLSRWPLLRRADLSGNPIAALPALPPLLHLERLDLADTAVTAVASQSASCLPRLARLDLSFSAVGGLEALEALGRLPSLGAVRFNDSPVARLPGYREAAARLLPFVTELDGTPLEGRGGGGTGGSHGRLAAAAAAVLAPAAMALVRHIRRTPLAALGAGARQRGATMRCWLPALLAEEDDEDICGGGADDGEGGALRLRAAIGLAGRQAAQRAALASLKPEALLLDGGGGGGAGASGAAAGAGALPAWLMEWQQAGGEAVGDVGCPELAAAVAYRARQGGGAAAAWEAREQHEELSRRMASRHLRELLEPTEGAAHLEQQQQKQGRLVEHPAFARRIAALEAAAELETAARSLQAGWQARAARMQLAAARAAAREAERARRCVTAATTIQAAARGWRTRRRLAAALAAARAVGVGVGGEASLESVPDDFVPPPPPEALLLPLPHADGVSGGAAGQSAAAAAAATAACPGGALERLAAVIADRRGGGRGSKEADAGAGGRDRSPDRGCGGGSAHDEEDVGGEEEGNESGQDSADADAPQEAAAAAAASKAARLEAKLRALMAEWGFSDLATARAYHRRQQRALAGQQRAAAEARLKDPHARLRRLQQRVSSAAAVAATATSVRRATLAASPSVASVAAGRGGGGGGGGERAVGRGLVERSFEQQEWATVGPAPGAAKPLRRKAAKS